MADRVEAPKQSGLSSDQLADEQAQALPDREAMSVLGIGGIGGPLPLPSEPVDPTAPISVPEPPHIVPPTPPATPPIPANISPEDASTLVGVAGDLREVSADLQGVQTDIRDINTDLNEAADPKEWLA